MTLTPAALKQKAVSTARTAYTNARISLAGRAPTTQRVAVIYGNCQAEALLQVLKQRPGFVQDFRLVSIPPVQSLRPGDLPRVQRLLGRADLFVCQGVRDNYRQLPIGSGQMGALLPMGATVVRFPSMFYSGLHPYHAYVHASSELGTAIPLTDSYHDLRHLAAAGRGLQGEAALDWLHTFVGDPAVIRDLAEAGIRGLAEREKTLDVSISEVLRPLRCNAFHTLNHPSNAVLAHVADQIAAAAGAAAGARTSIGPEILGFLRAPVEADVASALALTVPPGATGWNSHGRAFTADEVCLAHLDWYRDHPDVLAAGLAEHADRLDTLGLGAR